MRLPVDRSELFSIHPGHEASDQVADGNPQERDDAYDQGTEKARQQEIPFPDRRCEKDLAGFQIEVPGRGAVEEGRDHQQADQGEKGIVVLHYVRGILQDIARTAADCDHVAHRGEENEQGVDEEEDIYDGLTQPVSQFEAEQMHEHDGTPFKPQRPW
jgi:hypothetical protein